MTNMDFRSEDVIFNPIDIKERKGSMLLLARKKIILPEKNTCGETNGHIVITISARC